MITEDEFWIALQFRLSRELERQGQNWLCVGLCPDDQQHHRDVILASAQLSQDNGATFGQYRCQLWLPPNLRGRTVVDWTVLLPSDSERDWLTVDHHDKWIGVRADPARRRLLGL